VPAISKIDGTVAVALKVAGTVAKPAITGSTTADVKFARFENSAIPVLTGFKARIDATGDRITLTELGGEAGGGRFGITGSIAITDPAKPEFDLSLKSKDVLVLRDDSVLVRAETDIALRGPLNSAAVSGTVHVVQSRFNKEIEILPLALPGKPKPVPAAVAPRKTVSFPNPPLRDWTFNVAVKTRVDDPFLIRGNLAKGKVALDVRLAGTGRAPYLTGAATIEQFSAVLPLSTLTTRRGLVTFSEDMPFEPRIELEAESTIRQYTVVLRLDGPASKPRLDLESEPPLPQQEILSLLTTGSLSGEVGSNNTAMATRAAVLVVKSWYKKLFKRDFPLTGGGDGDSLLDRFEVDFGAVDPKTGRNETTAQLRVTDRLFFIGDLQLGGGFSGRVKYLFRFR
jgi:autotransporter translocation and assembly factor TamB